MLDIVLNMFYVLVILIIADFIIVVLKDIFLPSGKTITGVLAIVAGYFGFKWAKKHIGSKKVDKEKSNSTNNVTVKNDKIEDSNCQTL